MKSILPLSVLFAILIVLSSSDKASPSKNDIKPFLDECKMTENATDEDVATFLNHKTPQNLKAQCLLACLYEKSGVTKGEQIQVDGLKAEVSMRFDGTNTKFAPIDEIVNECSSISYPERCEQAEQIKNCLDKSTVIHELN